VDTDERVTLARRVLADLVGGDDAAAAGWAESSPESKEECLRYVAKARDDRGRRSRAEEVRRVAAKGPLRPLGVASNSGESWEWLRWAAGGI